MALFPEPFGFSHSRGNPRVRGALREVRAMPVTEALQLFLELLAEGLEVVAQAVAPVHLVFQDGQELPGLLGREGEVKDGRM